MHRAACIKTQEMTLSLRATIEIAGSRSALRPNGGETKIPDGNFSADAPRGLHELLREGMSVLSITV